MDNVTQKYFETLIGAINIAPIKVSGQYKIVVDTSNNLWLDDYTGRRVKLDRAQSFLEQIARFLSVQTNIPNNQILRYGAFQRNTKKSYHVPLYIDSDLKPTDYPNYFVLLRAPNTHISKISELYTTSLPVMVKCLKQLGIHRLFDEIRTEAYFDYPLYFDWESNRLDMYGYGINERHPIKSSMNLQKLTANQAYFDVVSNKVLNHYSQRRFFFPRFINLEFEFDYTSSNDFENFMGYISHGEIVSEPSTFTKQYPVIKIQNQLVPKIIFTGNTLQIDKYFETVGSGQVVDIIEQQPQMRFGVKSILNYDSFNIYLNNRLYYSHQFSKDDVSSNPYQILSVWRQLCLKLSAHTNYALKFNAVIENDMVVVSIKCSESDKNAFDFHIPTHYIDVDETRFNFKQIKLTDLGYISSKLDQSVTHIRLNEELYEIIDRFKFNGNLVLRFNKTISIQTATIVDLIRTSDEQLIHLKPIDWLTFYSDMSSEKLYDIEKYKQNLKDAFHDSKNIKLFKQALDHFTLGDNHEIQQYIYDNGLERLDKRSIDIPLYNEEIVKFMFFGVKGTTSHLTPYVLNFDKQFYIQNGSVDFNPENHNDYYKYAWFMFGSKAPQYLKDSQASIRFCPDLNNPPVASRLVKISDKHCECVFFGIKYQLHVKYAGFRFYVVLNYNDPKDDTITYNVSIDNKRKLIRLNVNRFVDYNDLIRGGDEFNNPIIDLSLLYNISDSSDYSSPYNSSLYDLNLSIEPFYGDTNSRVVFNNEVQQNWIAFDPVNNYQVFCIKQRANANGQRTSLLNIYPNHRNGIDSLQMFIYNRIESINYQICSITFKNVTLAEDYLWCSDIVLNFFEQDRFFIDDKGTLLRIWKTNIIDSQPFNYYMDLVTVEYLNADGELTTQKLKMLKSTSISFKQEYFDFTRILSRKPNGEIVPQETLNIIESPNNFKYLFEPRKIENRNSLEQLIASIKNTFEYRLKDDVSDIQGFNLFDVNQIWLYVRNMMRTNGKIKQISPEQVKKSLTNLQVLDMIQELKKTNNSLEIDDTHVWIRIDVIPPSTNLVIWDSNINNKQENRVFEINRYNGAYFPLLQPVSEIGFQLNEFSKHNTLWNLFDHNYCNGLGFVTNWDQVQGNIVSTLFTNTNIEVFTQLEERINYHALFGLQVTENQMYAGRTNLPNSLINHIFQIDRNYKDYIIRAYIERMLQNYYYISDVIVTFESNFNQATKSIKFYLDGEYLVIDRYQELLTQIKNFRSLKIIFSRK